MKWKWLLPLLIAAGPLLPVSADAQFRMVSSVVGTGNVVASGENFTTMGTLGQAVIGPVSSSSFFMGQGFWYTIARGPIDRVEEYMTGDASETMLWQNEPNPFATSTTLRFSIPNPTFVSLRLYDRLGRQVRSLIEDERPAGTITVRVSADGLESGSYTAQLVANGTRRIITMIVVK